MDESTYLPTYRMLIDVIDDDDFRSFVIRTTIYSYNTILILYEFVRK